MGLYGHRVYGKWGCMGTGCIGYGAVWDMGMYEIWGYIGYGAVWVQTVWDIGLYGSGLNGVWSPTGCGAVYRVRSHSAGTALGVGLLWVQSPGAACTVRCVKPYGLHGVGRCTACRAI